MFNRKADAEAQTAHGAKGNSYNFIVVFFAALGSFTYGFSSSIIGAVFGLAGFFDYFNITYGTSHGNDIIGGTVMSDLVPFMGLITFRSCQWLVRWRRVDWGSYHLARPQQVRTEAHDTSYLCDMRRFIRYSRWQCPHCHGVSRTPVSCRPSSSQLSSSSGVSLMVSGLA